MQNIDNGKQDSHDSNGAIEDVLGSVDHLYRILELINEPGSGGLVDKIIIAQDSLSNFINTISPNAYTSLTKVDFKRLDSVIALPVGVYGSKDAFISFLLTIGILDDTNAKLLLVSNDRPSRGRMQSGLYVALPPGQEPNKMKVFIIYWPEQTTWDDDAIFMSTAANPTQSSYCTLPLFHAPHPITATGVGLGYVSNDGHLFSCKNPAVMQQAFHVIFVIDRSGSMGYSDRRPLQGTPVTDRIARASNNRLGAVYSSLYAFWMSRISAVTSGQSAQATAQRRDSYSVILFDHRAVKCITNDFARTPDQLIDTLLPYHADGGTSYDTALASAEEVMRQHWGTERSPVVIFLSDGECTVTDGIMQTFCRSAIPLGKPLSFHGVAFGTENGTLRRMAQIAREIQASVPRDPLLPATAVIESSFAEALDSIGLAQTFLGIAESLKKPRGSLFQG